MMFAEFGMQQGNKFTEGLAMPGHDFGKQKGADGGVAFGQIELGADTTGLFASQQNIALEHNLADVLESDGHFMNAPAIARGDFVEQLGGGKSFGQIAGNLAGSGEMPKKDGKDLVRRNERAIGKI